MSSSLAGSEHDGGVTYSLVFTILAASFGSGFQHGYNTGVLNEIQNVTMEWIRDCKREGSQAACEFTIVETTYIWAWIVSIFCLGGLVGGLSVGVAASAVGRKRALLGNNVFVFLGGSLMVCARPMAMYALLVFGRFFIGVAAGFAAGLTPMYLAEISPSSVRGAVGAVYQLVITCSILTSQVLGIRDLMGTADLWPTLLGLTMLPGLLQIASLSWCPESPSYLFIDRGDEHAAESALRWLRRSQDVGTEMEEMRNERDSQAKEMVSFRDLFYSPSLRRPLSVAIMMMLAQQLTGINAIIFYSTDVFVNAGLSHEEAQYATIGLGLANVAMTILAIFAIEKAGRKTLLLVGLVGMFLATVALVTCLLINQYSTKDHTGKQGGPSLVAISSVVSLVMYIVFFAVGPGPIPWFLVSELFEQNARPVATAVAVGVNWLANFLISWAFQPITTVVGPYVFLIFLCTMAYFIAYTAHYVPETKDKSIAEITEQFEAQQRK